MNNRALGSVRDAAETYAAGVREGMEQMREECAVIAEMEGPYSWSEPGRIMRDDIARRIRALSARAAETEKPEAEGYTAPSEVRQAGRMEPTTPAADTSPASPDRAALVERACAWWRHDPRSYPEDCGAMHAILADFAQEECEYSDAARDASLLRERAPEANRPGIAPAPPEANPCAFCQNENLCVEIHDDDHPGMRGFAVRCGSYLCGARGPVRLGQMDAVEAWNGLRERAPAEREESADG